MGLMDNWIKNAFSIYDSEERTVLKIIEKIFNSNKEMIEEIENKTDKNGDHLGSWQGLNKPTLSEEGLRSEVEKHIIEINNLNDNVEILNNEVKEIYNNCYTLADIQNAIIEGKDIFIPSSVDIEIDTHIEVDQPIKIINNGTIRQIRTKTCIFLVTSNDVIIEGGNYYGTDGATNNLPISYASAIILQSVNNCVVRNCKIYNCSYSSGTDSGAGIYLTGSSNCIVENNYIEGCYHGINTDAVFNGTISQRNIIRGNKIVSCKYGYVLDLQGNDYSKHIGDIVEENRISSSLVNGLQIDDVTTGFIIRKNIVENSGQNGIVIMNRTGFGIVEENTSINNNMCGMVLNHITSGHIISNVLIKKNNIRANKTDGIQLYNVLGITFDSNDIFDNVGTGIASFSGNYPQKLKFVSNEIAYNHGHGISLVDARGVVIENNSIYYNSNENENINSGICIDRANITTSNIFITNNIFWGENAQTHKYCIDVKASSYDFILVMGNQLQGAITGAISNSSSVKLKYNNGVDDLN